MKTWINFYDYYLGDVKNCTYLAAGNALRMAAQEFCTRTKVWRVTMDTVLTVANVSVYDFDLSADQEIVKILECKLDGQNIPTLLHDQDGNNKIGLIALNQREYILQPEPAAGLELIIKAALMPSNTATGIEDFIYASYARAIAKGAKAELYGMAEQPFSNEKEAMKARFEFEEAIGDATMRAAKAYSSAPLRVQGSFM